MTAGESREEQALRELNAQLEAESGPVWRRRGSLRVTAIEDEDGLVTVDAEQEQRGQVTRIPTGER